MARAVPAFFVFWPPALKAELMALVYYQSQVPVGDINRSIGFVEQGVSMWFRQAEPVKAR